MATIDWPTSDAFKPLDMQVGISAPGATWTAPYGGPTQRVSLLNDKLTARFSLPPLIDKSAAGQREALLFGIKSAGDIVRLHHWARPYPNGTLRGSPTLSASALAGARSIAIADALSGVNLMNYGGFDMDSNADGIANGWTYFEIGTTGTVSKTVPTNSTGKFQLLTATALNGFLGVFRNQAVTVGQAYTFGFDFGANVSVYAQIDWLNSGGGVISSSVSSPFSTSGRASISATAPALAVNASLLAYGRTLSATSASVAFDNAQFELGTVASTYAGPATLVGGDMLGVGGKLLQVAYQGVTLDDSGAGTVPLSLAARAAMSSGAAVTWSKPTSTWEILGIDPQLEYRGGGLQLGPEITLVEA